MVAERMAASGMVEMTDTFESVLRDLHAEKLEVMRVRHRKYGPGNINSTGLLGCAVRMRDKWERFWRYVTAEDTTEYSDESVRDTLLDLSNHADIARLVLDEKWGMPMEPVDEVAAPQSSIFYGVFGGAFTRSC